MYKAIAVDLCCLSAVDNQAKPKQTNTFHVNANEERKFKQPLRKAYYLYSISLHDIKKQNILSRPLTHLMFYQHQVIKHIFMIIPLSRQD